MGSNDIMIVTGIMIPIRNPFSLSKCPSIKMSKDGLKMIMQTYQLHTLNLI